MLSRELTREVRSRLGTDPDGVAVPEVVSVLREIAPLLSAAELVAAAHQVRNEASGLGPLGDILALPGVTDVLVNGPRDVWFDAGLGMVRADVSWPDEAELRDYAVRLAGGAGRRLDETQPFTEFPLRDGLRCHIVVPPVAEGGTCISVRVAQRRVHDLESLCAGQPAVVLDVLSSAVDQRWAFLVTGGTGSGKTTLLRAMLARVPATERIVVIEDTAELSVPHPHQVTLQTRLANAEGVGEVTLRALVRQALRMRPDRLVLGEVRGPEIVDLFAAMNSGHEGACATLHANAAADVVARVEALGMMAGLSREAVAVQLEAAVRAIIHLRRDREGRRRVGEIAVVADGRVRSALTFDADAHHYGPAWDDLRTML